MGDTTAKNKGKIPRFASRTRQLTVASTVELDPRLDFFAGTVAGASFSHTVSFPITELLSGVAALVVGFPFDTGT